jgi:hypothetical protein
MRNPCTTFKHKRVLSFVFHQDKWLSILDEWFPFQHNGLSKSRGLGSVSGSLSLVTKSISLSHGSMFFSGERLGDLFPHANRKDAPRAVVLRRRRFIGLRAWLARTRPDANFRVGAEGPNWWPAKWARRERGSEQPRNAIATNRIDKPTEVNIAQFAASMIERSGMKSIIIESCALTQRSAIM